MLVNIHKLKLGLFLAFAFAAELPIQGQVMSLSQCIDTAMVHNRSLQIGRNNIALSEQRNKETKASLIPKVMVAADYKYFIDLPYQLMPMSAFGGPEGKFKETQFGVPHNIGASIQVAMPLYNPQLNGAIQATAIASELAELQYQKSEEQLFFEISTLYYNAQILHHQLGFIANNLDNINRLAGNMKLMKDQMMAKGTDVSKVELQMAQLGIQQEQISSKYDQVMNTLKFAMGIPLYHDIQIETDISYQRSIEYSNSAITDIQLVNMQNRLLNSELKTLSNSRLPSVSLYGTYGQTGFGYDQSPNDFLKFFPSSFAAIQVSYPLFNGTVTQRKINQKRIEIQNSQLQLSMVTDQNSLLIENARRQRIIAQRTVENTVAQIKLAQSVYDQTVLQQQNGTATLSDILLSDNVLREAQQTNTSAIIDYLKADLELKKLTGNISNRN